MIENVYNIRSFAGCLRKGFGYILGNPWLVTRVIGPWAFVFSVIYVMYYYFCLMTGSNIMIKGELNVGHYWLIPVMFLILCIFGHLFSARVFIFLRRNQAKVERDEATRKLNEGEIAYVEKAKSVTVLDLMKEMGELILKMLPYSIWICIFLYIMTNSTLLIMLWEQHPHSTTTLYLAAFILLVFIIVTLVLCPGLFYAFYASVFENDAQSFKKNYRIGFRNKGKILGVTVMTEILSILICIIPMIPVLISYTAYSKYIIAQLVYEEPAEIPTFAIVGMLVVAVICLTIITVINLVNYTTVLFLYGSIKTKNDMNCGR